MKNTILLAIGILLSIASFCQKEISVDSVSKYIGQNVKICTKVYGIKAFESVTLLNLGASYPKSPLTLAILQKDNVVFDKPVESLNGEEICVTGTIVEHKGKPEIVITKQEQIQHTPKASGNDERGQ